MRATPLLFLAAVLLAAAAPPAAAWTPDTQVRVAREGARLAPPDLYRQIDRHRGAFRAGVLAAFEDGDPARHTAAPEGRVEQVVAEEAARAVAMIRAHHTFEDVVHQLGILAHHVTDANHPLAASAEDPREGEYFVDFSRYLQSAEPRLPLVFYGLLPGLEQRSDLRLLAAGATHRGRELYPLVGREYRRIGFASGVGRFDDRSTAFGVASLAFSHAVTDVARALRWVWLRAGGGDHRGDLPTQGDRLVRLPRLAD